MRSFIAILNSSYYFTGLQIDGMYRVAAGVGSVQRLGLFIQSQSESRCFGYVNAVLYFQGFRV